jgi:hypothetical protein
MSHLLPRLDPKDYRPRYRAVVVARQRLRDRMARNRAARRAIA